MEYTQIFIKKRECNILQEYVNKIRTTIFYADEPEFNAISKIKKIWISTYNSNSNNWKIIKYKENEKPINIAYLIYNNSLTI